MPSPRVSKLLRAANGSSQPWLGVLEDGTTWIVKFAGAGPGRDSLLAECIANRLGRSWGFPIPETMPVYLDSSVERVGTDEFWGVLDASAGWNLGIRYIEGAVDVVPAPDLPRKVLEAMAAFDATLMNWDRTQLSRNLLLDSAKKLWWIDHGSCRFLHSVDNPCPPELPRTHFLWDHWSDVSITPLPKRSTREISACFEGVPDEWIHYLGFDRIPLQRALLEFLARKATR